MIYAIDWGHEEQTLSVWNGKIFLKKGKMPPETRDTVIVTENIPFKLAKPFVQKKIPVMRCSTKASAEYREKRNIPKTHNNDAQLIYELYEEQPHIFREMKPPTPMGNIYKNYNDITRQIAGAKNRQWATDDPNNAEFLASLEKSKLLLKKQLKKELKNYAIWDEFLSKIKGIGPALAAGLICTVKDISKFENHSDLVAYMGLHVIDGKAAKKQKGQSANWSHAGKSLCVELIPSQFIRHKTPLYRGIYEEEKVNSLKIMEQEKDVPKENKRVKSPMHAERRAKRKVAKIFLHHFWKEWRELEDLPAPQPWAIAHGGHSHEILSPTKYPGLTG